MVYNSKGPIPFRPLLLQYSFIFYQSSHEIWWARLVTSPSNLATTVVALYQWLAGFTLE